MSLIEHSTPPAAPAPRVPSPRDGVLAEGRLLWQVARLVRRWPSLRRCESGAGAVVLLPGWKTPELSMGPLRSYLCRLGYDARHWGLGINRGDPEGDTERLAPRIEALAAEVGPVTLIGWSLGGVIARETARAVPGAIAQVLTYGTPVVGGPTYTIGFRSWGRAECERIGAKIAERDRVDPIQVPVAAIFSRRDAMVDWPAAIDRTSLQVIHYEVGSTHMGLGLDPDVWTVVERRLANPPARVAAALERA